jgi:alpha-L-fucosidase 2
LPLLFGCSAENEQLNPLKLWYDEPAEQWSEAVLIGNGYLGARIFGGIQHERIALNEGTFWSGRPHDYTNPEGLEYFPKIRDLVFAENYAEADKMANDYFYGIPKAQQSFQPLGDLLLSFSSGENVTDYYRELDMETGIARVTYNDGDAKFTREVFISYPDRVMVVRLICDKPGKISIEATLKSPYLDETIAEPGKLIMNGTWKGPMEEYWLISPVEGKGLSFQTILHAYPENGGYGASDSSLVINDANSVTLVLTAATSFISYDNIQGDPAAVCEDILSRVNGTDYKTLRQRHESDFSSLMGRIDLNIGADSVNIKPIDERIQDVRQGGEDIKLAGLIFQFGRYMLVSSSREGGQPANLQGIWNEDVVPPWGSKYTMNINTEMNYWPAEVCNLSECHLPLFDAIKDLSETGAKTARVQYGCEGWVVHHNFDLWRGTAPVDEARYGMWPIGGAWLCQHIWEHYLYTGDEQFLKEYYPVMKGYAEFIMDLMVFHPTYNWLVIPFSISPEHRFIAYDGAPETSLSPSTAMDIAIIRELFPHCIEASKILNVDAEFSIKLEEALKKIPPYQISADGIVQEWIEDWQGGPQGHNCSPYFAFFPGSSLTLRGNPEYAEAYRKFLEPRHKTSGWQAAWDMAMWARLENGEKTDSSLNRFLGSPRLGINMHNSGHNQSDGNFGFTAAVAECLLQSHAGEISLLPALPHSWREGSVTGLRARGGYEVDIEWEEGKLLQCEITSILGKPFIVRYGNATAEYSIPAGKTIRIKGTQF